MLLLLSSFNNLVIYIIIPVMLCYLYDYLINIGTYIIM